MDVYKPPRIKLLRQLTAICLLLSAFLWVVHNSFLVCGPAGLAEEYSPSVARPPLQRGAEKGAASSKDVVEWFLSNLPSHAKATLQSSCPPLNLSTDSENEFIISFIAIGDLHLVLTKQSQISPAIANYLTNVSRVAQTADAVVTNLASEMPNEDQGTVNVLRSLRATGIRLLSLANDHVHLNGDQNTVSTLHALEAADIRWLGLNAKKHEIIVMRGQKVGFLAFCGVHAKCMESSSLPFAPLKYSSLVATNAVDELKEHGVKIIIVLMHWGKQNSFFPDETALSIARHLAELQVSVVIGYHPTVVQDHAYFGRTLVLFSLGKVLSSEEVASFCWQKASNKQWEYSDSDQCRKINPRLRPSLLENEQVTRMYKIKISRSGTAIAEYTTLPLYTDSSTTVKRVTLIDEHTEWTIACGESDSHCLSCERF